jgi:EAL and modified HD-GYP domain-containing signal transduction protein
VLVQDDYRLLPAERVVIELLESVEVDDQVLAAVRRLKSAGYTLALDDFVFDPSYRPLMALADVIKIDFMACDADQCAAVIKQHARKGLTFLAEKVETHEQHQLAMRLGYGLFQGYYFKRPQMLAGRQLNSAQRSHLRFLAEASRNDPDLAQLEHVLHSDPALAVKLLRYLNSAGVGLGSKVHSLHHAMTLMGAEPLRKWAALVATSCLGQDKPAELMRLSLARARFCELACVEMGQSERSVEFFLLGLLSSLDAMLDQPLDEVLSLLPLDEQIKQTLLGAESALGTLYLLMLACEQGAWDDAQILAQMLSLEPPRVAELSNNAQRWADSMHYVN